MILSRVTIPMEMVLTNLVSCRPIDYDRWGNFDANRPPTQQEIERCSPKLQELYQSTAWSGIIYIGKVALNFQTKLPTYEMLHPAAISRMEYKVYDIKEQALLLTRFLHAQLNTLQKQADKDRRHCSLSP